jgi:hypothetical protein
LLIAGQPVIGSLKCQRIFEQLNGRVGADMEFP